MVSFRWTRKAECSKAFVTDIYESLRSVYFPTRAILTSLCLSWLQTWRKQRYQLVSPEEITKRTHSSVMSFHRLSSIWPFSIITFVRLSWSSLRRLVRYSTIPWDLRSRGTWYTDFRSCTPKTCSELTWQNIEILSFVAGLSGWGTKRRHAIWLKSYTKQLLSLKIIIIYNALDQEAGRDLWENVRSFGLVSFFALHAYRGQGKHEWVQNYHVRLEIGTGAWLRRKVLIRCHPQCLRATMRKKRGGSMKSVRISRYIYLDNAYVWLLTSLVYWDFGDAFDPILNRIRYMGDDLRPFELPGLIRTQQKQK